ncbi:hypothetical protein [Streptomyces canus]
MSRRYGGSPAELVISFIVDIAALILILWITLYLRRQHRQQHRLLDP